jgi:hypothetical protein
MSRNTIAIKLSNNLKSYLKLNSLEITRVKDNSTEKFKDKSIFICPLCFGIFDPNSKGDLSQEHIIPNSVAEKSLITITCVQCNNESGGAFDHVLKTYLSASISRFDNVHVDIIGSKLKSLKMPLTLDFKKKELTFDNKSTNAFVRDEVNRMFQTGGTLNFKVIGPSKKKLNLARIKVVHLMLFNNFGYDYLFTEVSRVFIEQIQNPEKVIIKLSEVNLPIKNPKKIFIARVSDELNLIIINIKLSGTQQSIAVPGPTAQQIKSYNDFSIQKNTKYQFWLMPIDDLSYEDDTMSFSKLFKDADSFSPPKGL